MTGIRFRWPSAVDVRSRDKTGSERRTARTTLLTLGGTIGPHLASSGEVLELAICSHASPGNGLFPSSVAYFNFRSGLF